MDPTIIRLNNNPSSVFSGVRIAKSFVICLFMYEVVCSFSFGNCIVSSSSDLPLLINVLVSASSFFPFDYKRNNCFNVLYSFVDDAEDIPSKSLVITIIKGTY
jgi:hypothetical protein